MSDPVKFFFAGDFCSKPSTTRIAVSDELKSLIQSCDFKVINFEVPLKPENTDVPQQKRERFFQHDDAPGFLQGLGFNLFQLANNHAFDWGNPGFLKTKAALGDAAFGAGTYEEAYKVKIVEIDGIKIGFLALSFAAYNGVFDDVMNHDGLGCAYINDMRVNHDIIEAKKIVDYLFVLPHDGIEYIDIPMPETIARYRDFIDYGADAVIGTHPHCPQGWETYKGKPIFYSLGNFLFNSKDGYDYRATNRPHWYEGLCVMVTITDGDLQWQVLSTRNVDNAGIEIDYNEARDRHNETICRYLVDDTEYRNCLERICRDLGLKEMAIIDSVYHETTIVKDSKRMLSNLLRIIRKKPLSDDKELGYLLKNDSRKDLLLRSIK